MFDARIWIAQPARRANFQRVGAEIVLRIASAVLLRSAMHMDIVVCLRATQSILSSFILTKASGFSGMTCLVVASAMSYHGCRRQ